MSTVDLRIVDTALKRLRAAKSSGLTCFEWGSGRSSFHFAQQLKDASSRYRWVSVEYNRDWFSTFLAEAGSPGDFSVHFVDGDGACPNIAQGAHFLVYDYGEMLPMLAEHSAHRSVDMDDYVESISLLGESADFIFVDGRKRNRCMFAASQRLSDGGVVFLHDAWRPYYALSCSFFRTAVRVGENLLMASHMPLRELLEYCDVDDVGVERQIQWAR